jgi:hypothetical protein
MMEEQLLEIIARLPELSKLGSEYIDYLMLVLLVKAGACVAIFSVIALGIFILLRKAIEEDS